MPDGIASGVNCESMQLPTEERNRVSAGLMFHADVCELIKRQNADKESCRPPRGAVKGWGVCRQAFMTATASFFETPGCSFQSVALWSGPSEQPPYICGTEHRMKLGGRMGLEWQKLEAPNCAAPPKQNTSGFQSPAFQKLVRPPARSAGPIALRCAGAATCDRCATATDPRPRKPTTPTTQLAFEHRKPVLD